MSIDHRINMPSMLKAEKKAGNGMSENQIDGTEINSIHYSEVGNRFSQLKSQALKFKEGIIE